jgi:hypothetical protein
MQPSFSSPNYDNHENDESNLDSRSINPSHSSEQVSDEMLSESILRTKQITELSIKAQQVIYALQKTTTTDGIFILKVFKGLATKFGGENMPVDQLQPITNEEILKISHDIEEQDLKNKKWPTFQKIKSDIRSFFDASQGTDKILEIVQECRARGLISANIEIIGFTAFAPANYNIHGHQIFLTKVKEISITKLGRAVAQELKY